MFQDITTATGIRFTYRNGEDTATHLSILESLGGGVGLIDYDGDGRLDVFLTGGGTFAGPDKKEIVGSPCKLFRNLGGGKFEDATTKAGLDKLAGGKSWFYTHGVAVGDYDRDGWPDLLVSGWGRVALFHNETDGKGGRKFVDVSESAGLDNGITWATSAAFADLDGDGYPDLYVCQYVDWSFANHPACTYDGKTPDICPPKKFKGLPDKVYRNTGTGKFVDVSDAAGLNAGDRAGKALGVIVVDVDQDGKPDVYVANDTVANFLYVNQSTPGKIRFAELGLSAGVALDDRGVPNGSMGLDAGDPERTGKPSLWVTNYENELHALYRNESTPNRLSFRYRSAQAGIAVIGQRYVGWGTAFLDADLDGWEDLFVANGHVIHHPLGQGAARKQHPVLLLNRDGKFREGSKQLQSYGENAHLARGVAAGDLDNDGRIDFVISHMNEPATVLRGIGGKDCHWIGVRLEGKDQACIVGAKAVWETDGKRQPDSPKVGQLRLVWGPAARVRARERDHWAADRDLAGWHSTDVRRPAGGSLLPSRPGSDESGGGVFTTQQVTERHQLHMRRGVAAIQMSASRRESPSSSRSGPLVSASEARVYKSS